MTMGIMGGEGEVLCEKYKGGGRNDGMGWDGIRISMRVVDSGKIRLVGFE
jgi:hypothetical protein